MIAEAAPEAGGWLRYGIPEYRLPREVLKREVDYLKRLRVEIRYNSPIGKGTTIDDLLTKDGFAAVFLGVGTQDSIRLPVPGSEAAGVLWGVEYLKHVNSTGESPTQGKRVAVIGGGNVDMDVGRVGRRHGAARGTLLALAPTDERPASSKTRATAFSSRPVTAPFWERICLTPRRWRISIPSALASATSQGEAGSSSGDSRAMRVTGAAPWRRATRATSLATLPPPMSATRLPWVGDSAG